MSPSFPPSLSLPCSPSLLLLKTDWTKALSTARMVSTTDFILHPCYFFYYYFFPVRTVFLCFYSVLFGGRVWVTVSHCFPGLTSNLKLILPLLSPKCLVQELAGQVFILRASEALGSLSPNLASCCSLVVQPVFLVVSPPFTPEWCPHLSHHTPVGYLLPLIALLDGAHLLICQVLLLSIGFPWIIQTDQHQGF